MAKKDVIEILSDIRNFRNHELVANGDNRVFYTEVMALEKGENTGKQIYRIIEEYSVGENQSQVRELFYEYGENGAKLIAKLYPDISDQILPIGNPAESIEKQNEWDLTLKDINIGIEKRQEKIREQALKIGIDKKEIEGLSEIDLDKKVYEKITQYNKQGKLEKKEQNEPVTISNEEAKAVGIIGNNTISLNQKVGAHGEILKGELGLDKEQYADIDDLEIVPSYKLNALGGRVYDVPFVAVGKRKNGELVVFPEDECAPYKGENNTITKIDGKDDSVKREKSDCIIQFPKKNTSLVIDQKSPYGIVDASLAYNTRDNDGRVALDLLNKYEDGTREQNKKAREVIDPHHGIDHAKDMINEVDSHPKSELENDKLQIEEADGDPNTGHKHLESITSDSILVFEGKEMKVSEIASDFRFKLSTEEFIEKYNRIAKQGNLSEEQIYDEIEDESNKECRNLNELQ